VATVLFDDKFMGLRHRLLTASFVCGNGNIARLSKLTLCFGYFQVAAAVAFICHDREAPSASQQSRHGVLHRHPLHDASVRHPLNRVFQLAHEQRPGFHDVSAVFCVRGGVSYVRVQFHSLPCLVAWTPSTRQSGPLYLAFKQRITSV